MENLFKLNRNENIAETEDNYYEKIILEPYYHVNENKGNDFRNTWIQIYNYWLKLDKPAIKIVSDFSQRFHAAILLVDDIQDFANLRRGIPAAHVIYGVGRTIVATDCSRYKFVLNEFSNQPTEFVMIALNCMQKTLEGEIMEIYLRDNFICPSEEEYLNIISKKTGQLILTIMRYMQLYSETKINLNKLTILLGMYVQIADDYSGLKSQLHFQSKGFCDDIREGKFIYPFIHAIKSRPNDTRILDILKMRTTDTDLQKKCLELLEEFGSMEYTKNKLNNFKYLIIQEMKQFGFNKSFKAIFENQNYDQ